MNTTGIEQKTRRYRSRKRKWNEPVLSLLSTATVRYSLIGANNTFACCLIFAFVTVVLCSLPATRSPLSSPPVYLKMCEIKSTIKVTFSHGCEKPNLAEMVNFAKKLDGDSSQIEAVYKISEEKAIFVKYKGEEAMLHALESNCEDQVFNYANGKTANVRLSHAGEYVQYVRVYDLPPEVSDQELAAVLSKYGKVKRVIREKFPTELCFDVYTGVRGIYMDVKTEIPTSLHFLNRKGNIFYQGNKNRCFLCKMEGHLMNVCPKRKVRKEQQNGEQDGHQNGEQSGVNTYAGVVGVVSNAASSSNGKDQTETQPVETQEGDMVISSVETSEDETESSVKNNIFYKLALKIKEKQDEERENKRLQESRELRGREKSKAKKKMYK